MNGTPTVLFWQQTSPLVLGMDERHYYCCDERYLLNGTFVAKSLAWVLEDERYPNSTSWATTLAWVLGEDERHCCFSEKPRLGLGTGGRWTVDCVSVQCSFSVRVCMQCAHLLKKKSNTKNK